MTFPRLTAAATLLNNNHVDEIRILEEPYGPHVHSAF
jgi:hypothetical protein